MNCELDWFMQQCAHDRGRCLITSIGKVLSAAKGDGIAHCGRSLRSMIALLHLIFFFSSNMLSS